MRKPAEIRKIVRKGYARIAKSGSSCGCAPSSCCAPGGSAKKLSRAIGYREVEMDAVPEGANLGLGCGNPTALASIRRGETVLDLGSGAGFDSFLAARRVGPDGKVIGVDMTPEMVRKARANAKKGGYANVEFRLGEIENLPVDDDSVDLVISNCVINLVPDKKRAFKQAFRVLKPGGRMMVSDIVLAKKLPRVVMDSVAALVGCLAGALLKDDYLDAITAAGFRKVEVLKQTSFPLEVMENDPTAQALAGKLTAKQARDLAKSILSIGVKAVKPKRNTA